MAKVIKVMIVDDSAVVRQTLSSLLEQEPDIEVIATAPDPLIAEGKIGKVRPDVLLLDIEMPRMDGLTFLRKIMASEPLPVVICSTLTEKGSETSLQALQAGAVEVITKPRLGARKFFEESRMRISDAVRAASQARIRKLPARTRDVAPKLTADAVISSSGPRVDAMRTTDTVVVVGASTGGTEALRLFLEALPYDSPGIVIVQHMPEEFTAAFARRLDTTCRVSVEEARNGDSVIPGRALIAPGNKHVLLKRSGARYYVEVKDGPLVCRHRPSVDVLFRSASRYAGKNALGVIMTGMGDDGARGMLEMKQQGAFTIAQDEQSCIVFGMPKEAIKLEAVDKILPLDRIAQEVLNRAQTHARNGSW
ncbi:MAG: chemotaxis response regulator protein-glutamate methylesterase [Desulfuromonas sp.]|nr:MAG: chemotaxis response regulator protein-glutamate methylesterase [Desulfuromonas sp.]